MVSIVFHTIARDSWRGQDVCYTQDCVGSLQGTQSYECEWLSLYISLWTGNLSSVYRPISPLTWYLLDKLRDPLNVMNWLRRSQHSQMFVECISNMSLQKWFPNYFETFCSNKKLQRALSVLLQATQKSSNIVEADRYSLDSNSFLLNAPNDPIISHLGNQE